MSLTLPPVSAPSPEGAGFPVYEPTTTTDFAALKDLEREKAREDAKREGRELLFTIDGVDFFMPKYISPQMSFKMLRDLRRHGEHQAAANMIAELIGEECLDTLADTKSMGEEDWKIIIDIMQRKVFGRLQEAMGKA